MALTTSDDIEAFIDDGEYESLVEAINLDPELVNSRLSCGFSPLMLAFNGKNYEMCEFLIMKGAKMDYINEEMDNTSILMLIITWFSGHQIEMMVLDASKDIINHKDDEGNTALHYACLYKNELAVEELLKKGANINAVNNKYYTPLMYLLIAYDPYEGLTKTPKFCTKKTFDIVKLLVEHGADTSMENYHHKTAEDILLETKTLDKDHGNSSIYGEIYFYVGV